MLARLDSVGNNDWQEVYGDQYQNYGNWVEETSDGGYIIAGKTYTSYSGKPDWLVIKTSSEGDSIWSYTYGMQYEDVAHRVIENTADGNYLVIGDLTVVVEMVDEDYYYYPFGVNCLDTDGNLLWQKIYGLYKPHMVHDASLTHDGNLMAGGTNLDPNWTHSDIFLYEIDASSGD